MITLEDKYEIRILQPIGGHLASQVAAILCAHGLNFSICGVTARKQPGHELVYLNIQKGQTP